MAQRGGLRARPPTPQTQEGVLPAEENTKPGIRRQSDAYQGTVEAVFAILVALGIGYFVDQRFETFPIFMLVGVALGFAAFVLRLLRLGRDLQQHENPESDEQNDV